MYTSKSDTLSLMTHNKKIISSYRINKKDCEKIIDYPFESMLIPIPQNYDRVLKSIYNDYFCLPSKEERGKWHERIITFEPEIPYWEYKKNISN